MVNGEPHMFGTTTIIHRNADLKITPNFSEKEFFTKCPDFRGDSHLF